MRVRDAFPGIFQKAYPVLDPKTETLSAMSLLRFHEIDALPLSFDLHAGRRRKVRAVYGYSSLARLVLMKPEEFGRFLREPCEAVSESLAVVSETASLARLLDTFAETRFGFARVEGGRGVGAMVGLPEVLGLHETGAIVSDLHLDDVGSPIVSVSGDTPLRKALGLMFEKRHRRLFVDGQREFVSDRRIIEHIFSPAVLAESALHNSDVLGIPVSAVGKMVARDVELNISMKDAAALLKSGKPGQCLVFDGTVVTPWDVVMKPWKAKKLKIRQRAS